MVNIEFGAWYPCINGDQAYLPGGIIALEAHITVASQGPNAPKCPSRSGDVQIYIPISGDSSALVFGSIIYEFSMRDCFSSIIPRVVLDIASKILDAKLGLQLQFGVTPFKEKSCQNSKCVGYVTTDNGGCWLKKEGAFFQWPQARKGVHSYILTNNDVSYKLMQGTDGPGSDIYYADGVPSSSCWWYCTMSLPAWCGGYMIDSASLNTGKGRCWLKTANAFRTSNMRPLSWAHSYVKVVSDAETYRSIENYDSWGSDLQYQSLPSSDCRSACDGFNAGTGRLGDFPRNLIGIGKGYGNIRFLNMGADFDLSLNFFYGAMCSTGQYAQNSGAAYMGLGVDLGVRAWIDFWFWEASVSWRTNILPPPQDPCKAKPFSSIYFADDNKGYYVLKTRNQCKRK